MITTRARVSAAVLALLAIAVATVAWARPAPAGTVYLNARHTIKAVSYRGAQQIVWQYTDGDTMWVAQHGHNWKIRLTGINTPEIYGTVECSGPQAAAYAKRIAPIGWHVTLIDPASELNTDRYGQYLHHVSLAGRGDFGADMIRSGLAKAYYDSISPRGYPWHPYQAPYRALDARYHYGACPAFRV